MNNNYILNYNSDILLPHERVITPGGEATFTCLYRDTAEDVPYVQFQWFVNGTQVEELNLGDRIITDVNDLIGHIHFINVTVEYNDTTVQCRVNNTSGDITFSDNNATLFVQGEESGYLLVANTGSGILTSIVVVRLKETRRSCSYC